MTHNDYKQRVQETYGIPWSTMQERLGLQSDMILSEFFQEGKYKSVVDKIRRIEVVDEGTDNTIIENLKKPVDYLESKNYLNPFVVTVPKIKYRHNRKNRLTIDIEDEHLEASSIKRCTCPLQTQEASQRGDLFLHQKGNSTVPHFSEKPVVESQLAQDILCKSTCIRKAKGQTIKLLKKFEHQKRRVYLYEEDGVVKIHDTTGTIDVNGYAATEYTDLDLLEIGETYDIGSNNSDEFYISYPKQFKPKESALYYGCNVTSMLNIDINNADDSAKVSESFVRKMVSVHTKIINIHLKNKRIVSQYKNLFPEIGELIKNPVVCRIVQDTGPISELALNIKVPSGYEDSHIYVEPNSYIASIEVYCNRPINDNPKLEKLRLDTLKMREDIYNTLEELHSMGKKLDNETTVLKENYRYSTFRTESTEINYPYIRIKVNTLDIPQEGSKFSNFYGGKFTIQKIYKDGTYKDEDGNNIEIIYPSTAIISRNIPGLLNDMQLSAYSIKIKSAVNKGILNKDSLYNMITEICNTLNLENEWEYANLTKDELWELLSHEYFRWIILPYSHDLTVRRGEKLLSIMEKYVDYKKSTVTETIGGTVRTLTDKHSIGFMYCIADKHVPLTENSSCSKPEQSLNGYSVDKDSSKRDSLNLVNKQPIKLDIQVTMFSINMVSDVDAHVLINTTGDTLYAIHERMAGQGAELVFTNPNGERCDVEEDTTCSCKINKEKLI